MLRTPDQNIRLHYYINKLSIDAELKEELVFDFTGGRETSSSKMLMNECENLIQHLRLKMREKIKQVDANDPAHKRRGKVLSICHEMQWTINGKVDWKRLNFWMEKYSYLHKPLHRYKLNELPQLITQFEQLLKHYYDKR